jgi:hypothetical protein
LLVAESTDSALNGIQEVIFFVGKKSKSTASLVIPVEFENRVLEATGAERNYRGAADEKLVLDDTTRLEHTWHETEISAAIDNWTIIKEFIWFGPEAVGVVAFQSHHPVCTISRVRFSSISRASDQELDPIVVLLDDLFCNIEDHMNAFLLGNPTNECK